MIFPYFDSLIYFLFVTKYSSLVFDCGYLIPKIMGNIFIAILPQESQFPCNEYYPWIQSSAVTKWYFKDNLLCRVGCRALASSTHEAKTEGFNTHALEALFLHSPTKVIIGTWVLLELENSHCSFFHFFVFSIISCG